MKIICCELYGITVKKSVSNMRGVVVFVGGCSARFPPTIMPPAVVFLVTVETHYEINKLMSRTFLHCLVIEQSKSCLMTVMVCNVLGYPTQALL